MVRTLALAALLVTGCGSRCAEVAHARDALATHGVAERGPDVEVAIPFQMANLDLSRALIAHRLKGPIELPDLGPIALRTTPVTAEVRSIELQPAPPGRVRFAVRVEIDDPAGEVATVRSVLELVPRITPTEIVFGLSPENIVQLAPDLPSDTRAKLGAAVMRWIPAPARVNIPQRLLDAAAQKLGDHLTGDAWKVLQKTLLARLGEVTRLRMRLPDVPVAHVDVRSRPEALVIAITTTLPVRAGLAPDPGELPTGFMTVRIAGSAAAELANWALDKGYLPPWYTRSLSPSPHGEFRPRFDYVAGSHPLKVFAFQERGGCSYFKVGVDARVGVEGDKLVATATDRELEAQAANPAVEAAAWVKFFLTGWVDRSKRIASHTKVTIGDYTLDTRADVAALAHDQLVFGFHVWPAGAPPEEPSTAANGSGTSSPSIGSSGGIANRSR